MSTVYYVCTKEEHERSKAIADYIEQIRGTLHSYLDISLPPELKDELQITDDLEKAVLPMCSKLEEYIGYDPQERLCTITGRGIVWHNQDVDEVAIRRNDKLVVIDEYGQEMEKDEFLIAIGRLI